MGNIQWMYGDEPKNLSNDLKERIRSIFFNETGEEYTLDSISNLPIPKWGGNMLLIDQEEYPAPESILGVLWALPHEESGVRIAAFVLDANHQSCGWGGKAWEHLIEISLSEGKTTIQLEVKAENTRAQEFYKSRGLAVIRHLPRYYSSGIGYEMKGPL
jgi:ribosomal protein S18 acetylase RimI-like enzyme